MDKIFLAFIKKINKFFLVIKSNNTHLNKSSSAML